MLGKYKQNRIEERESRQQQPYQRSPQKIQPDRYRNVHHGGGQENSTSLRNIDLNRNLPKGKPLISPKISAQTDRRHNEKGQPKGVLQQKCTNHPAKKAEFSLDSEQGEEYFCGRCAAQLATQGCEVRRLQNSGGSLKASKRPQLPCYPQFQGQPIYEDILSILRLCGSSIDNHSLNMERFSGLQDEYQQQIDQTSSFYDRLAEIVAEMKADHLEDLALERDKYVQIAEIQNDHLRENIIQINVIRNDIQNHLEEVLEGILESGNAKQCRESLEHYRQKLTLFAHQLEEQQDSLKNLTRYSHTKLGLMVEEFQDFLQRLWQVEPNHQDRDRPQNLPITVKNIHQILPRGTTTDQPSKKPFRNLEEEEDEPLEERKSPNFKKI